jgi:hypothetical protein
VLERHPPEARASDADRDRVLDVLRAAVGDGRLTADEHEARAGAALTARTLGDLAGLTADLPGPAAPAGPGPDVARLKQRYGALRRAGRWSVPPVLELKTSWCTVTLDFTEAAISHATLRLDLDVKGGSVVLLAAPGMVIESGELDVRYTDVDLGAGPPSGAAPGVRLLIAGKMRYGEIQARWPS